MFDKDGTLISLESYWLEPAELWVAVAAAGSAQIGAVLRAELGLNDGELDPDGPLSTATTEGLADLTRRILEAAGVAPEVASRRAVDARRRATALAASLPAQPIGDVAGTFRALAGAGLRLAVATTDEEQPTREALVALDVADMVEIIVAADSGMPAKPDPAVLAAVAAGFGIEAAEILMVGDSQRDAATARNGGAAGFVLVARDGRRRGTEADAVIRSIAELTPRGGGPDRR